MPIRWRLTLFNALIIGAILLVLGLSLFLPLRHALLSGVEDTVRDRALEAAQTAEAGEELTGADVEELTLNGVFVVVRDGQGNILSRTANLPDDEGTQDPVWSRALEGAQAASGKVASSSGGSRYVYAVPVNVPDGSIRVVEAGKSYEHAEEEIRTLAAVMAAVVAAAFLLSAGGAYVLARAALSPVDAVVASAREIKEGDLSKRLPVARPKDEIGRLAATVNDLLGRLESAFARREEALSRQRRFAADASHELRTPLASIGGYARMLEAWALEDPKTARESVSAIREESERMREMVEGLLALTRGDEGVPLEIGTYDLAAVVGEAVRAARAAAGGKVTVEYLTPEREISAALDQDRVRQAVGILLDNAVKYTPGGGRVTVAGRERDGFAGVEVSDTGIGIPEDQLPLVFERFHRADPARATGGAGLGLAIARQIAEAHGGRIEAESTPGEGSVFTLLLPKGRPVLGDPDPAETAREPRAPASAS